MNTVRLSQLRKLRECDQVAAVCYRVRDSGIEFLLIQTRGSGRWTFPKGSAEPGLTHAQAAALEAFEEAGVHGRIEEASFACYVRRKPGGRNSSARSSEKAVPVNAHLCEVLRLGNPKESRRNRTWFSVEDAKRRLREGRKSKDGAEFVRVVDRATARIEQLLGESNGLNTRSHSHRPGQFAQQRDRDPLQKVQFDFAEAYGRIGGPSLPPYIRRQLGDVRRSPSPGVSAPREVLECEVLQFAPPRSKAKALAAGARNG